MNKQTYNRRKKLVNEDVAEQVGTLRIARSFKGSLLGNNVEAVSEIPTDIKGFNIPIGSKGKVLRSGSWFDVYYVDFLVHGFKINVCCKSDAISQQQ